MWGRGLHSDKQDGYQIKDEAGMWCLSDGEKPDSKMPKRDQRAMDPPFIQPDQFCCPSTMSWPWSQSVALSAFPDFREKGLRC